MRPLVERAHQPLALAAAIQLMIDLRSTDRALLTLVAKLSD